MKTRFIGIAIFFSLVSALLSYPKLDWILLFSLVVIAYAMRDLYGILILKRWYVGLGRAIDENNGEGSDIKFMKYVRAGFLMILIAMSVLGRQVLGW